MFLFLVLASLYMFTIWTVWWYKPFKNELHAITFLVIETTIVLYFLVSLVLYALDINSKEKENTLSLVVQGVVGALIGLCMIMEVVLVISEPLIKL